MSYKIKAEYSTGDSNGSWEESRTLEMAWESLEVAKEALERIKEHYGWYKDQHGWDGSKKVPRPHWAAGLYESQIIVHLDNGNEVKFVAPWCGYFERLYRCSIIAELPSFEV